MLHRSLYFDQKEQSLPACCLVLHHISICMFWSCLDDVKCESISVSHHGDVFCSAGLLCSHVKSSLFKA